MPNLNILFIASWYPSENNSTHGVFIKEHAKAADLCNDIVVVYSEELDDSIDGLYSIDDRVEDGLRTLRVRYKNWHIPKMDYFIYLWSITRAYKKLQREGFKADIVHGNVFTAGVSAALLGRLNNIPVVVSEHFSGFPRGEITGMNKLKAKFAFKNAEVILPVSEYLEGKIRDLGVEGNFKVVPNVVDTNLFYPSQNSKNPRDGKKKRLLFVGSLSPKKGISYLLNAVKKLVRERNDIELYIVGEGAKRAKYERNVRRLEIENYVSFQGRKNKGEVAAFMRSSDLFVLPSPLETFGTVLIEAMASGLPIVSTEVGGPSEIITEDVGALVPPENSEILAKAINEVLNHLEEYSSDKIRNRAVNKFSQRVVAKKLDSIYSEVMNNIN